MDDFFVRNGLWYKQFTDVPFTGEITGKRQGSIKNGKKDGAWVYYSDSGQIVRKGNWKNGHKEGAWVSYDKGGQVGLKGNYKNGKMEGVWVGYNKDGTVFKPLTGTFKGGKKISD